MASFRRRRQHRRSAITLPFRKTRRNNNSRSASDQTVLLGLPLRASFFAFLSRRFCLRSLAATFLVLLPPLSLVPIGPSRPATEADPHCLTPSPLGSSFGTRTARPDDTRPRRWNRDARNAATRDLRRISQAVASAAQSMDLELPVSKDTHTAPSITIGRVCDYFSASRVRRSSRDTVAMRDPRSENP